jgi:hypothetical protein
MQQYIVCENKGSHPRIHVKICAQKCLNAPACSAYQEYLKAQKTPDFKKDRSDLKWSSKEPLHAPA